MNRKIFYLDPAATKPNTVDVHRHLVESGIVAPGCWRDCDVFLCDWAQYADAHALRAARGLGYRLNHLPTASERLHHKKAMTRLLDGRPYLPRTFLGRAPRGLEGLWVEKPYNLDRGRGITFLRAPRRWRREHHLLQRYVEDPWLINGGKTEVRMLARLDDDGSILAYEDGRIRVADRPYDPASNDPRVHNANAMFQQRAGTASVDQHLMSERAPDAAIVPAMVDIVRDTAAVLTRAGVFERSADFEILGYDFVIDRDHRPWLLEVNRSPGFYFDTDGARRFYLGALEALIGSL